MEPTNEEWEEMEATVRAILDDVIIQEEEVAYVDNYPSWVIALRNLSAKDNSRVFVQLAVVARQFFDAGSQTVGSSLATLARIGLVRLSKTTPTEAD